MKVQQQQARSVMAALLGIWLMAPAAADAYTVYVSSERDNTITVVDGASLEVKASVKVGPRPRGIALSKDLKSLYICTSDADHIEVLNLTANQETHSLPSGPDPELLALDPNGRLLYVANEDDNMVTIVDVDGRTGHIRILGHELAREGPQALAALGVVFQQPTLDLDLSLRQNLRYHGALHGLDPTAMAPRIESALAEVGLADRAADKARQLSGGQHRRLELARALLHRPRLLLADEPTVGLDVHSRRAVIRQVREGCRDQGVGVLWATHLVDEVEPTDQVVVLHRGRVLSRGSAAELIEFTGTSSVHDAFSRLTAANGLGG